MAKRTMPTETPAATKEVAKEEYIEKEEVKFVVVKNCDALRVRKEPSTNCSILTTVPKDTKLVYVEAVNAEWAHIKTLTGHDGYVMSAYIG